MNVTKCENGHFFDIETYEKCPHCGAGVFSIDGKAKSKNKLGKEKEAPSVKPVTANGQMHSATVLLDEDDWGKEDVKNTSDINVGITPVVPSVMEAPNVMWQQYSGVQQEASNVMWQQYSDGQQEISSAQAKPVTEPKPMKTIGVFQNMRSEPVTGWLVCVEGDMQGEAYNIVSGNNKIGRNINMDICIPDPSISGENQAILTFDPKSQNYFIKPGEGKALMYFNDEEDFFDERRKLKAYDKLAIGNAKFVFVPLCGDNFSWNDYMKDTKDDEL